jgi:chromosome segregation ATPase
MWRAIGFCVAFLSASLLIPAWSDAQNKNKNNKNSAQEKKDDQRIKSEQADVKKAQESLKDDQKELQDAQKELDAAEAKEKATRQQLEATRKRIEARIEAASGIDKALAEQDKQQAAYDAVATPVLNALKQTPEYQAALKRAKEADARIQQLRDDTTLPEDTKRKEIAQASKIKMEVSDLERTALESNSSVKAAKAKLSDAQSRVNDIRNKIRNQIESDAEISSGVLALRRAADATEAAGAKVLRIRQKIAADTAKLAQEQRQLQQAQIQDKANDKKNQNNLNKRKYNNKRRR